MRKSTIAALVAGQLIAAQPAVAADPGPAQEQRAGAFGGLRLRVPLDGDRSNRQIRAGLTLAPTLHGQDLDGRRTVRIGEGVEFGYRSNRPLSVSLAGRDLGGRRFGAAQDEEADGGGPSTLGWIAIGVGAAVVATFAFGYALYENTRHCGRDC